MGKFKDITGSKYNHLTALKYVSTDPRTCAAVWTYRCDCGNEKDIESRTVTAGRIKTCGNCELKHKLKSSQGRINGRMSGRSLELYQRYVRNCNDSGKKWALSTEQFRQITQSNCSLCNTRPNTQLRGTRLRYNRLVLIDIHNQYTEDNVGCLCSKCYLPFGKIGISQAIDRVYAITSNLNTNRD